MSDWAKRVAEQIKADREQKRLDAERLVVEHKIKNGNGPKSWTTVRDALIDKCAELNEEMGTDVLTYKTYGSVKIIVTYHIDDKTRELDAEYNTASHVLDWSISEGFNPPSRNTSSLAISADGSVFFPGLNTRPAVENMIDKLVASKI